ncbi:MAG: hypothetical protein KDA24_05490 [Deltaproteobacteria bacterium]|nr:hypothetical protein [Deltaproteobacteria bacterium]
MPDFVDPGPLLTKEPDARLGAFPQLPAVAYIYLALLIGIVPTAAAAVVFALSLRRVGLAAATLAVGLVGFVTPLAPFYAAQMMGAEPSSALLFFGGRLLSVALGFALYKLMNSHVRGHEHLEGAEIPLMWAIMPAFAALLLLPNKVAFTLVAPILVFLSGS